MSNERNSAPHFRPGHVLADKYVIDRVLGQGAMGEVFRAVDPLLGREVAVKTMSESIGSDPDLRRRFQREAQSAARISHPNIIKVYELGLEGEQLFMAMELLDGVDLKHAMAQRKLSLDEKLGIVDDGRLIAHSVIDAFSGSGLLPRLPAIETSISELLVRSRTPRENLAGVAVAIPGIVDTREMRLLSVNKKFTDAVGFDLVAWAQKKWQLPLLLENDARSALVGEWQYGAGRGCDNLAMVTLGTGIGGAVLIEGKVLRGKHFQPVRKTPLHAWCEENGVLPESMKPGEMALTVMPYGANSLANVRVRMSTPALAI